MSFDWESGGLAEGLACYRRGSFFEAHEHWEDVWRTLNEPEKSFLQALIQLTAAFHHRSNGNSVGAVSLLGNALRRLEKYPSHFGGIAVAPLRAEISEWLRAMENGAASTPPTPPRILPTAPPSVE